MTGPHIWLPICPDAVRRATRNAFAASIVGVCLVALGAPAVVDAQSADTPESLTLQLVTLDAEYQTADPGSRPAIAAERFRAATRRQARLAGLIARDPGAVLRVAVPTARR